MLSRRSLLKAFIAAPVAAQAVPALAEVPEPVAAPVAVADPVTVVDVDALPVVPERYPQEAVGTVLEFDGVPCLEMAMVRHVVGPSDRVSFDGIFVASGLSKVSELFSTEAKVATCVRFPGGPTVAFMAMVRAWETSCPAIPEGIAGKVEVIVLGPASVTPAPNDEDDDEEEDDQDDEV